MLTLIRINSERTNLTLSVTNPNLAAIQEKQNVNSLYTNSQSDKNTWLAHLI